MKLFLLTFIIIVTKTEYIEIKLYKDSDCKEKEIGYFE